MKNVSMSRAVFSLAVATIVGAAPVMALTSAEIGALNKQVVAAKAVEVPTVAARLVKQSSEEDRIEVAASVVTTAIKNYPATIGPVITSVLRACPQATEAVVKAALAAAPNSSLTIVAAAAEGAPAYAGKAVAVASAMNPGRAASYEREVAVVRGRTLISSGAVFTDVGVTQKPLPYTPSNPPAQVYGAPLPKGP